MKAAGNSSLSGNFTREKPLSFHMENDGDDDGDGLPNKREEENGTDPTVPDADKDPDNDGIPNDKDPKEEGTGDSDGIPNYRDATENATTEDVYLPVILKQ